MSDTAIEALRYSEFPNSSDCISRQAAIDAVEALAYHADKYVMDTEVHGFRTGLAVAERQLELVLAAAQPEQRTGKWNTYYHGVNENPSFTYSCNQCGHSAPYGLYGGKYSQKKWAYCPNCGAKMEGD